MTRVIAFQGLKSTGCNTLLCICEVVAQHNLKKTEVKVMRNLLYPGDRSMACLEKNFFID